MGNLQFKTWLQEAFSGSGQLPDSPIQMPQQDFIRRGAFPAVTPRPGGYNTMVTNVKRGVQPFRGGSVARLMAKPAFGR